MDELDTQQKIMNVYICSGITRHIVSGLSLLKRNVGMVCPYCFCPVDDCTDTPLGQAYFQQVRPDKFNQVKSRRESK